jgi:D-alanyl-D-alanine-carboxypeptidase/D-alanyl-D-alanine-endopeptidase
MKTLLHLIAASSLSAQSLTLVEKARISAEKLPKGCIVCAEQSGNEAPVYSLAGKTDVKDTPPEKILFEIGSISKVFTGLLLAKAVDAGKVRLDSTLQEVMGKKQRFASPHVAAITLEQLATHTSGLPRLPDDLLTNADPADPYVHYDRRLLDSALAKATLAHAPPYASEYSNLGVGLLGDLLARLHDKSWEQLVLEHITEPLGMKDTRVTLDTEQKRRLAPPYSDAAKTKNWHFKSLAGCGALYSTAADLMILAQALSRPSESPIKSLIEQIEKPRDAGNVGLCLQILNVGGIDGYWHNGGTGGYRSWLSSRPESNRLVVVLINNNALAPESIFNVK